MKGQAPGPAGLGRRFAALVYDSLLLVAVLFLGTLLVLPLTGGEAITPQDSGGYDYLYRGWIALLTLGFFGLPWVRTGQTLGMMSWKLRLERLAGAHPGQAEEAEREQRDPAAVEVIIAARVLRRDGLAAGERQQQQRAEEEHGDEQQRVVHQCREAPAEAGGAERLARHGAAPRARRRSQAVSRSSSVTAAAGATATLSHLSR